MHANANSTRAAARSRGEGTRPWGFGVFMLVPLLLLAGLGWRGMQMSRMAAQERAATEATRTLEAILPAVQRGWSELRRTTPTLRSYEVPPEPAPEGDAQVRYQQALAAPGEEGMALLANLAEEEPEAVAESGVPLLPLVDWARLKREQEPDRWKAAVERVLRAAVESRPSILTPQLLGQVEGWVKEHAGAETAGSVIPAWRERWEREEAAREAVRKNRSLLAERIAPLWLATAEGSWWAEMPAARGTEWKLIPREELERLASSARAEAAKSGMPTYLSLNLALGGVGLFPAAGEALARRAADALELSVVLSDATELFAQQRQQTRWLAALLACGFAGAVAAFASMQHALARERELGRMKSDFVSSVSHELRAPLASVRLLAENLANGSVAGEERKSEYHAFIAEECQRLSGLIENVLDFARIEQRRKSYVLEETDVAALTRETIRSATPRARQRGQTIESEIGRIEPPPVCDGLAVRQALLNLLENAIKFSPEGSVIQVRLAPVAQGGWELSVQDRGIGIPKREQARIFDRFYRVESELRRETQGAGIGLAIVRHVAEAHGAKITVASEPGAGATFTLHFPANDSCRVS